MTLVSYAESWSALLGTSIGELNFWVEKGEIPLGTLKPFESYAGGFIPDSQIVTIKFDKASVPTTSRKAMNVLMLGASGDGKSLLMKIMWYVLHNAGYYCGYIDPKSTDSGRAVMKWSDSPRLPPNMMPAGIPREHFVPIWATRKMDHLMHNFRIYSAKLSVISEKEMWQGLGMSGSSASKVASIVGEMEHRLTINRLRGILLSLPKEELSPASADNAQRVLVDVEDTRLIDESLPELKLYDVWRSGKSVCVSYNNTGKTNMTFDIGLRISESADYYFTKKNRNPIMWFLDDGYFYADNFPQIKYNYALEEIKQIGFNYRSLGVYNCLAVQTLSIVDQSVAEGYRIKIISPLFANPDSLAQINIPKKARDYLKEGKLVIEKEKHLMQWMLIDDNNDVIPFYPFTPPCGHFQEIYFEKEQVDIMGSG